jgi:membrane protein
MPFSVERFRSAVHLGGLSAREAVSRTWNGINDHAVLTRAAAISFYAIAAIVPFLGLLIVLTSRWLPLIENKSADGSAFDRVEPIGDLLPAETVAFLSRELDRLRERSPAGLISFSVAALLWFSSSVFVEIIDAMNAILGLRDSRSFWKRRFIAMAMTVGQASILIIATLTIVAWPQITGWLGLGSRAWYLAAFVHGVTVPLMIFLSFAVALQVGPDTHQRWEWIIPGSLLATLGLLAVSHLFRTYVQHWGDYSATYGSLAGIIGLMTWLWLSTTLLLVAAELNRVIEEASPYSGRDPRSHPQANPAALGRPADPNAGRHDTRRDSPYSATPTARIAE